MTLTKPNVVVIDTNVISYIFKGHSLGPVYDSILQGKVGLIAFQTIAELEEWVRVSGWGQDRKGRLDAYLSRFATVQSDPLICRQWALVRQGANAAGRPIAVADAWIAATALAIGCPLVTHNAADFAAVTGLDVLTVAE